MTMRAQSEYLLQTFLDQQQCAYSQVSGPCKIGSSCDQHGAWPKSLIEMVGLQVMGTMQLELSGSRNELRKTQQLLRQLERQLAKSHMSRKEAATASQQMQVSMPYFCICVMHQSRNQASAQMQQAVTGFCFFYDFCLPCFCCCWSGRALRQRHDVQQSYLRTIRLPDQVMCAL